MVMPTTTPPAATWGTEPNPTRPAAPPAARQPGAALAPPAAPAPGATLAPPAQPMAKPAAPVAPAAPAAPAPAPVQNPMVPAYVAKAMERQRAKEEKENAMVPVPGTGAPAPTEPAVPLARQGAAPASRAASVTPDQPVTPPATEQQPATPVVPEPSASGVTPPTAEDAPEVVAAKTEAEQTFADLMAKAQEWMNAKEDPASRLAFSHAITQSALVNQEAMNAVRGQIAANPALAGQPAGDALLALRASQIGTTMADLKGNLAIQEQRAISDLNRLGFEATMKLNEIRKTEDERNLASYGAVLDEMIRGGADEATLEEFFNTNIKPLLPGGGAGMTLDQFRNAGTRAQLLQAHRGETRRLFREAVASKAGLAEVRQLMNAAYTPEEIAATGQDWAEGKSLEEVNAVLREAGYDEIEDLSLLIEDWDMLGEAKIIADAKAEVSRKPYDDIADDILEGLGIEYTPEMERDVRAWVRKQELGILGEDDLPPWEDEVTAHLYKSWPLAGTSKFGEDVIELNPDGSTTETYKRNEALNSAWDAYVRNTPADSRITREEWYNGMPEGVKSGGIYGAGLDIALAEYVPPKKRIEAGNLTEAEARNAATKRALDTIDSVSDIDFDDPDVAFYMESLPVLRPAAIGNAKAYAKDRIGEWINYGGKYYRIEAGTQGRYHRGDRHRDFMTLTAQDGSTLYVGSDGRTTTKPPPDVNSPRAFGAWYDSMEAP